MKKTEMMNKLSRNINKVGFKLNKNKPEIMIIAGCIGAVGSAIMACKATTKVSAILDETKDTVEKIHMVEERAEKGELKADQEYSAEDAKKDLSIVYVQTGMKLARLYAPSVILGTLSIASIIGSHNIMKKRNVALAAAYTAVDKGFKEYRSRVVERFGQQVDKELKYNVKAQEIEETVIDAKGKEKTVKKTVNTIDGENLSEYAVIFNKNSKCWEKNHDYNLMFLKAQRQLANDMLISRGHLFLNEVYDMLDIPRTAAGQVVGWVYNPENPVGDNYVDFIGLEEEFYVRAEDAFEKSILLDFNVDGYVLELM